MSIVIGHLNPGKSCSMMADKGVFYGNSLKAVDKRPKINSARDFLFGCVGDAKYCNLLANAIINHRKFKRLTAEVIEDDAKFYDFLFSSDEVLAFFAGEESEDEEKSCTGEILFATPNQLVDAFGKGTLVYIDTPYFAVGAANHLAIGAMEAIHTWHNLGCNTQNEVNLPTDHDIMLYTLKTCGKFSQYIIAPDHGGYDFLRLSKGKEGKKKIEALSPRP